VSAILVVDDEPPILRTLAINLRARGYDVQLAKSGHEALALAARRHPDVVVLDLGLPDMDGIDVIHGLRGWTSVPIIVLSARTAEAQKVAALDAGANDYVSKPFGMDELMARLRVALRTTTPADELPVIETTDFTIDLAARRVRRGNDDVRLTATEWQVVEILARNPGKLITQRHLLEQVWGITDTKTNYVRVFMVAIRKKLEPDPAHPRYFITEPGSGLRFMPEGLRDREPSELL
jgi:two-component system, OmpR family, KDP operon response regulator KdpE